MGRGTKEDWETLLARTPERADNATEFSNAVHLFYTKEEVNRVNVEKLNKLSTPIVSIKAVHSCSAAASAKSDNVGGLEAALLLAEGAKVMLTCNLWQQTGLCNGATGTAILKSISLEMK